MNTWLKGLDKTLKRMFPGMEVKEYNFSSKGELLLENDSPDEICINIVLVKKKEL